MTAGEKLCLQWNNFSENASSAFGVLRADKEFTDVTLACEDGQQVEAHKVVLLASSPLGKTSIKKKTFSFGHCPNYLNPPPLPMTPIRATWSSFFGSRNSRFESQFRTKNTIYTI